MLPLLVSPFIMSLPPTTFYFICLYSRKGKWQAAKFNMFLLSSICTGRETVFLQPLFLSGTILSRRDDKRRRGEQLDNNAAILCRLLKSKRDPDAS